MATKNFRVRNGIEVGPATGSTNNVTIDGATGNIVTVGDIAVNGGDVTTTSTTANLFNSTATTVNIAGAATTANIGFSSPTSSTTYTNNIINGTTYSRLYNTTNNSIVYPLNLSAVAGTGITPTIGYGVGVKAQSTLTDGSLGEIGKFEFESTAILFGDNDSVFKIYTYENGLEYKTAEISTNGAFFQSQVQLLGEISGHVALDAGFTPAEQTYTLPQAYPAVSGYVLSSTTGGAMSWIPASTGTGDVVGPASATDDAVARFDGTTGKLIKNSTVTVDNSGNIVAAGNLTVNGGAINGSAGLDLYIQNANSIVIKDDFTQFQNTAGTTRSYFNTQANQFTFGGTDTDNVNNYTLYSHNTFGTLNNGTIGGDLAVNGGDITTTQTTASLFNTTTNTLNISGAATTTNIGATNAAAVTNVNNNVKLNRDGSLISGMMGYNGAANSSTGAYDATRRFNSSFAPTIVSASGTGSVATVFFTPVGALYNVAITGTAGQFSCTNLYGNTIFAVNDIVYVTGTLTGTGTITGYTNPKAYYIIATNGTTTFTLSASLGGGAITTTAGTTTGLTFSDPQYPAPYKVGAKVLVTGGTAGAYHGVQTVTASTPYSVSYSSSATGVTTATTVVLYESIGVKGISLSNANAMNQDTWLNFRTFGAESTNTPGGQSVIQYEAARGTLSAPLPNQNGDFLGAFYLQSNLGNSADTSVTGTRYITTATSGTGSVATLTYTSIGSAPVNIGAWVTISGVVPAAYNGTYQVISASTTQITYYSSATGSMTQPGFINALGSSTGSTAGTTPALNFTTDSYRFPPEQFAFNATENHRTINLGTFTASAATSTVLTVSAVSTTATTAASGTGSVATLTFAANATASPPFLVGGLINVEGVTPTGYNGTYQVLSCSSTSVTFANTTTGVQTVAGTIKNYLFNGFQFTPTTATTPIPRTSTPFIFDQLTTTNANGLLGAEGTYTIGGVAVPIAWTDTCTYSTMSAGMGVAFDQAAKSRVYNPSNRIRTFSLTPEITEFCSGQFGFSPQQYSFTDRRRLLTAITGGNTLNIPWHGLKIGDTLAILTTSNGLTAGTAYYVATIVDVNNITLASDSALTTAVTGLTNGTGLNKPMQPFTNPTGFNLNLRNFRGNFNSNAGSINTVPNVLNDQLGQITFAGSRSGSIASPIGAQPSLASSSFANCQIQTQTASITAQAAADWTATSTPSKLVFATTAVSSVTPTNTLTVANSVITAAAPIAFPAYTIAGKPAAGAVGQQICISDSPVNAGKMAYWDTTNSRWSYIDTNTAV